MKLLFAVRLLLITSGIFFLTNIYAENNSNNNITQNVSWHAIGPAGSGYPIQFFTRVPGSGQVVLAGNIFGGLYKSYNGGKNWVGINNGLYPHIESIAAYNETFYLAGTQNGLYETQDGGLSWQQISTWTHNNSDVVSIAVLNSTTFLAVVGSKLNNQTYQLLETTNNGANWKTINLNGANPFQIMALNPTTFLVATSNGLLKSTDGGSTWQHLNSLYITGIKMVDGNTMLTFNAPLEPTSGGAVYKTVDGGQHWQTIYQVNGEDALNGVAAINANTYLLVLNIGGVIETTDGGNTWNPINNGLPFVTIPPNNTVYNTQDIFALDANNFLVGSAYGVYSSTDGGKNWVASNNGISNSAVAAMSILNQKMMVVAAAPFLGSDNTILPQIFSTIDGGTTWKNISGNLSFARGDYVYSIFELDPNNIFVSDEEGFYRTSDGGNHWQLIFTPQQAGLIMQIVAVDPKTILLAAGPGVYKSTDGGATWTLLNIGGTNVNGIMVVNNYYLCSFYTKSTF